MPPGHAFAWPGGRAGVLLVHGLAGTPTEMRFVARGLHAAGFTVHAVQLAGHCGSVADLVATGWRDWAKSVDATVDALAREATLYGVFILPSRPVELEYLPRLHRHQVVTAEALARAAEKRRRALEIVEDVAG